MARIIRLKVRRVNPDRLALESVTPTAHHQPASASRRGGGSGRGVTHFGGTPMRRTLWLSAVAAAALVAGPQASAETITSANKSAAQGLIPDELIPYVVENNSDLNITIKDAGKYVPNAAYVKATVDYACQAKLDAEGRLTNYTAGQPFPFSDWAKEATGHKCDLTPDDPQFPLKLAWDVNFRWQGAGLNIPHFGFSYMRNNGNDTWRITQGEYRRTYFAHRADLPEHSLDKSSDVEWAEFFDVKTPFDLRGTMFLLFRYNYDAKELKEDQ